MRRIVIALGLLLGLAGRGECAAPSAGPVTSSTPAAAITPLRILARRYHPWLAHDDVADVRDSVRAVYTGYGDRRFWVDADSLTALGRAWLDALQGLDAYGVPPADVDARQLADSAASYTTGSRRDSAAAELDVALSASVARALRALHGGRVRPGKVDSALISLHAPLPIAATLDSVLQGGAPREWLGRVQPRFQPYWRLVDALARYREADTALVLPARAPRLLKDTMSGAVARLRRRLALMGDLAGTGQTGTKRDSVADAKLIGAIGRFQRRHTLDATGRLDSLTWVALRTGMDERIEQMGRTLEHWRWLPHDLYAPLVLVNIPAFRLAALDSMDEPDSLQLKIAAVVGTAYTTQTPVLTAALTSIDFMPDWDVPPGIAEKEVKPAAQADSTWLRKNHMDLIKNGQLARPTPVNIEALGHGVRARQQPGPDNPLGRVKFVMPNRYDVYLHDTPAKYLFERRQRDFSHGCIRLGNAPALARWLMRGMPQWSAARIDSAMADTTTLKVRLPVPVLVAIVYATAEADARGRVRFHPDVYGHDRSLELLLAGAPQDSVVAERQRGYAARHPAPAPVDSSGAAVQDTTSITVAPVR